MQRYGLARFIALFGLLTLAGFLLLETPWAAPVMWHLKVWTSQVVAALASALGTPAVADGSYVRFGARWIHVIDECTGVYAGVLLTAFLLAFPHAWRRRGLSLLLGLAVVATVNVLRLVALVLLMEHRPSIAGFAHDYLWQVIWAGVLVGFAVLVARRPVASA